MKLLTIIGTRPEAIKMAPVLRELQRFPEIASTLAVTGQHRELLAASLAPFALQADVSLNLYHRTPDPLRYVAQAVPLLAALIQARRPDCVLVQGDTASAMAGALAAKACGIRLGHVEAGLRTHAALPWPEEPFRRRIDAMSDLLFAPTPDAAANLRAEGVVGTIFVTGNTGIDALLETLAGIGAPATATEPPYLLVTLHRRENAGGGVRRVSAAIRDLAVRSGLAVKIVVHPNPRFAAPLREALTDVSGVDLLPPQGPAEMVRLMQGCSLILTDSGGIQEEAPTLGKPVVVLRAETERPEGIDAGFARLAGTSRRRIVAVVEQLLSDPPAITHNPYGDGRAAERIVAALRGEALAPFATAPVCATEPLALVA